jgi:hypothetical protein
MQRSLSLCVRAAFGTNLSDALAPSREPVALWPAGSYRMGQVEGVEALRYRWLERKLWTR